MRDRLRRGSGMSNENVGADCAYPVQRSRVILRQRIEVAGWSVQAASAGVTRGYFAKTLKAPVCRWDSPRPPDIWPAQLRPQRSKAPHLRLTAALLAWLRATARSQQCRVIVQCADRRPSRPGRCRYRVPTHDTGLRACGWQDTRRCEVRGSTPWLRRSSEKVFTITRA